MWVSNSLAAPAGAVWAPSQIGTQIASQIQIRDRNGVQAAMTEIIADGQAAHDRRSGTGQNGSANRSGAALGGPPAARRSCSVLHVD